jgi:hypothetical protein
VPELCFLFSSVNVHTGLCHINGCTHLEHQKFVILFNNIFSHDAKVMSESRVEAHVWRREDMRIDDMSGGWTSGVAGRPELVSELQPFRDAVAIEFESNQKVSIVAKAFYYKKKELRAKYTMKTLASCHMVT